MSKDVVDLAEDSFEFCKKCTEISEASPKFPLIIIDQDTKSRETLSEKAAVAVYNSKTFQKLVKIVKCLEGFYESFQKCVVLLLTTKIFQQILEKLDIKSRP